MTHYLIPRTLFCGLLITFLYVCSLTNVRASEIDSGVKPLANTGVFEYNADDTSYGTYARFCDESVDSQGEKKSLKIAVMPGKSQRICMDLWNQLNVNSTIHVSFTDGAKDSAGNPICENEDVRGNFGQYVSGYSVTYDVPSWSYKRIFPEIKMPVSAAGTVYGCATVYNDKVYKKKLESGGVTTLVRNAIPMEVFVDTKVDVGLELSAVEDIDGYNLVSEPMHISKQTNGGYLIAVGFKNIGGLDENVEVQGTVTDVLKKVTELAPQTKTVGPEGNGDVRYEIPALPWYKMWFTVDMTVTHNAVSEFRTEFITEKLLEKKTINVSKTFFVFPWWLVGVLIVLLLIIHLINRSRKHHHDEEKELEELKKRKADHGNTQ